MTLVWEDEPWWKAHIAISPPWWRVKVSADDPSMLAYYRDERYAWQDRWVKVKPGRYLGNYIPSGNLSEKQRAYWAAWQAKGVQPVEGEHPKVFFATTPDEIVDVYLNGPASCMSHGVDDYTCDGHPVRIYGAGDLAIAYLIDGPECPENGNHPKVIARAICYPEHKAFGRAYPTEDNDQQEELRDALRALGYKDHRLCNNGGLAGARMLRIECGRHDFIMPYLDVPCQHFEDNGEYLILATDGDLTGCETNGTAASEPEYEYQCESCEEGFNDDPVFANTRCSENGGYHTVTWCSGCAEGNTFYCEGFSETFSDDVSAEQWNGETYTVAWLDANTTFSDFSGERIADDYTVTMHDGAIWSAEEFEGNGFECIITGDFFPNELMHPDRVNVWIGVDDEAYEIWHARQDARQETMAL